MLKSLLIKNYALIDNLEIDFGKGFIAITGETGAGKSILLGALSLILGNRADSSVLRQSDTKCVVEALFNISGLSLENFFDDNELDFDDNCILRREILPSGKSRAFINDTPVKLNIMKAMGLSLVDVHSQHQTLQLGNSSFQLQVIDRFGTDERILKEYRLKYKQYILDKSQLNELISKNEQNKRDRDYFQFQLDELLQLKLDEDYFGEMKERSAWMANLEQLKFVVSKAQNLLMDDESSVYEKLSEVVEDFSSVSDVTSQFKDIYERLNSLQIELKDIVGEIERQNTESDFSEDEMEDVDAYLSSVYSLMQKHSLSDIASLVKYREEIDAKLQDIEGQDNKINSLSLKIDASAKELKLIAENISKQRSKSATEFGENIKRSLNNLGMPVAEFQVELNTVEDFGPDGINKVDFLFSANAGIKPDNIAKIASGGELSRLMLAIKSLVSSRSFLPTIIFDEIDTGVSGDIAGKVGNMLLSMSNDHQLIAITHLPQIAAKAASHYFVYKQLSEGRTISSITMLDESGRVEELAKMLSDEKVSDAARAAARGLLKITSN